MEIAETSLPGVVVITPDRHEDSRGYLSETWSQGALARLGLETSFVQDNQSFSRKAGTVRGLHCQLPPHAQDKLVRVTAGRIIDVAVDIRRGSPFFGQSVSVELSAENHRQSFVPKGFLHGFVTLEDKTEVFYKCSAHYHRDSECAFHFADPDLAIDWAQDIGDVILSEKDARARVFAGFDSPFIFGE